MGNELRKSDISNKLQAMGEALIREGFSLQDLEIIQLGTIVKLVGTVMLSESDMFIFGQLCSMFSSKKILDGMKESEDNITDLLKDLNELNDLEVSSRKVRTPKKVAKKPLKTSKKPIKKTLKKSAAPKKSPRKK